MLLWEWRNSNTTCCSKSGCILPVRGNQSESPTPLPTGSGPEHGASLGLHRGGLSAFVSVLSQPAQAWVRCMWPESRCLASSKCYLTDLERYWALGAGCLAVSFGSWLGPVLSSALFLPYWPFPQKQGLKRRNSRRNSGRQLKGYYLFSQSEISPHHVWSHSFRTLFTYMLITKFT